MDTLTAMMMAEQAKIQGRSSRIFDWNKAAQIIKDKKPIIASAGLSEDWEWTGGTIFADGKPADKPWCIYLASIWATPQLDIDGEIIECYIDSNDNPNNWNADTFWPETALNILNGKTSE